MALKSQDWTKPCASDLKKTHGSHPNDSPNPKVQMTYTNLKSPWHAHITGMGQIGAGKLLTMLTAKEWSNTQRVVKDSTDGQGLSGCSKAP